jgi:hypothetical protein
MATRINWRKAVVVGVTLLLGQGVAHADIYHCIKPGGTLLFTDSPCPPGTRANGVTRSPPPVPLDEAERQRTLAVQIAEEHRIADLEQEVAQLRAALQSPPPQPAAEPAVVPEAEYVAPSGIVVVGGCQGRNCAPHRRREHDGDGGHREHDGDGGHHEPAANPPSHPNASLRPPT